jgi:hypothetical protein
MFILVRASDILARTNDPAEAIKLLVSWDQSEVVGLAEILSASADPRTAIPGELDRAIDAWNLMTHRIKAHVSKVTNRDRLVKPFRKWKCEIGQRTYMLEQLMPDIEAQPFIWQTITFGWLFRAKSGEFNSDKLHARKYLSGGNGNGQITERDYLVLAARIATWQKSHVDGASFEEGTGVSWQKWQQLKEQFNGAGA